MATEDALFISKRGGGRQVHGQSAALVVAGNSTVKQQIILPAGAWLNVIRLETATAISGTPTSCLVNIGITDGGSEVVAAVDAKAQGHISATIVAAFDTLGAAAAGPLTLYVQVVTSGGTSSAGTINARVDYLPVNP